MNRAFPRAEDLILEELDYELEIRSQPEEVFRLDISGKQRHLRSLFKEDQREGKNYYSNESILDVAAHIEARITNLAIALEKKSEPKFQSRVLHYWYRVKRCIVNGDEDKKVRRDLIRKIEQIMQEFRFGPPMSPFKEHIKELIQESERKDYMPYALQDTASSLEFPEAKDVSKGAIPKQPSLGRKGTQLNFL